jgi:hypothetical protein
VQGIITKLKLESPTIFASHILVEGPSQLFISVLLQSALIGKLRCASASLNCANRCFLKHRTCVLCPLLSSSTHFQRISRVFLFTSAFVAGCAFQLLHVPERFVLLLMSIISKIRTNDPSSNHEVLAHQKTHRNHLISVTE